MMTHECAQRPLSLLLVLLLAVSLSHMLQVALFIELPFGWVLGFSIAFLLFFELVGRTWKSALVTTLGMGIVGLLAWLRLSDDAKEAIFSFLSWAYSYLSLATEHPHHWAIGLMAIITALVTLYCWFFGHRVFFLPALIVLPVALVLFEWLIGHFETLHSGMVCCAALLLFWIKDVQRQQARKSGHPSRENALPLLLAPLIALMVLISVGWVQEDRARDWQSRRVYNTLERVNNYLADFTGFTRPRSAFSLSSSGFMPMGNRLGGPVALTDREVLSVQTELPLLLRGSIYNTYDGAAWSDMLPSQRYRINNANMPVIEDVFDTNRPQVPGNLSGEYSKYVRNLTVNVKPLINGPSTIFVPYRGVRSITSDQFLALLPYISTEGEAFSTTDIRSGYSYTIDSLYLNYRSAGFGELMEELQQLNPGATLPQEHLSAYLALPDGINPLVYELAHYISGDIRATSINESDISPYEAAVALQQYLQSNYEYSLEPSAPPADSDFVSHFLLAEKRGYCTYYASSMTVMARMLGIPARYVEGYMVNANGKEDDGSYTVRSRDAHAWAELHFAGIGWIPFDATPYGQTATNASGGTSGGGDILPGPTMEPTADYELSDDVIPGTQRRTFTAKDGWRLGLILLVSLALFVLLWCVGKALLRRRRGSLGVVRNRYQSTRAQYAYYYFMLLELLAYYNYPVKRGETLYAFAERIDRWLRLETSTFGHVADIMASISYSDYQPTDNDVRMISDFYHELARYTYHTVGWWFYLKYPVLGFRYQMKND